MLLKTQRANTDSILDFKFDSILINFKTKSNNTRLVLLQNTNLCEDRERKQKVS